MSEWVSEWVNEWVREWERERKREKERELMKKMIEKERRLENERMKSEDGEKKASLGKKKERMIGEGETFPLCCDCREDCRAIVGSRVRDREWASERAGNAVLAVCAGPARGLWPPVRASQLDSLVVHAAVAYPGLPMLTSRLLFSFPFLVFDFPHASSYVRLFEKKEINGYEIIEKRKRW